MQGIFYACILHKRNSTVPRHHISRSTKDRHTLYGRRGWLDAASQQVKEGRRCRNPPYLSLLSIGTFPNFQNPSSFYHTSPEIRISKAYRVAWYTYCKVGGWPKLSARHLTLILDKLSSLDLPCRLYYSPPFIPLHRHRKLQMYGVHILPPFMWP